jgi:hypothetical protein
VRFFFDNTLSFRLARALDTLLEADGHRVVALRDYPFDPRAKDEEWLPVLARERDWIVITGDLSKKDKDRHVWIRSGLTVFFLQPAWTGGGHKLTDLSARLLRYWPRIAETARTAKAGSCFSVSINGHIKKV